MCCLCNYIYYVVCEHSITTSTSVHLAFLHSIFSSPEIEQSLSIQMPTFVSFFENNPLLIAAYAA